MNTRKLYCLCIGCIILSNAFAARMTRIDTLKYYLNHAKNDSDKVNRLLDISVYYNALNYPNDEDVQSAQKALEIAKKHNYFLKQEIAYSNIAYYYELKGENNEKALQNFLKAADIASKNNLTAELCNTYNLLSDFYWKYMKNEKKALEYSRKAIQIEKQAGFKQIEVGSLSATGSIYYELNEFKKSIKYYEGALSIMDSLHNKDEVAAIINNIGSAYTELNEYAQAIEYYRKSSAIYRELNDKDGEATSLANIGNINDMKGDAKQGTKYSLQALTLARQIGDNDLVSDVYAILAEGYSDRGNYKMAFKYQTDLSNLKDTLFSEANSKQVNEMQVKYDTEKKEHENKILELNVARQKIINYSVLVGLLLVLALAFFVYRGYVNKKKAHAELAAKNKIIEEKNKDIMDSINYAKTIQNAILMPHEYLEKALGDYFIVYKPRDVVSGDFYWCYANDNKVIFAVADCTGHGVPGAFMSMMGNSLLNEVVIENKITDAPMILDSLRTALLKTLQQKEHQAIKRDGMDIALCVWDKQQNIMQFAGANNPLYLVRNNINGSIRPCEKVKLHEGNLVEFLPDKQPIGYQEDKTNNPFGAHVIKLQKGDMIYLSSDGFADQFGGETGKKYTRKKFRETLASLAGLELHRQKTAMDKIIDDWKGNEAQTDDICLVGLKCS